MSASSEVDAKASRRYALQLRPEPVEGLRMLNPRHPIDRFREVLPDRSLAHERAAPAGGEAIVAAPALPRLFDPASFDHALALEAIERRVKRSDVKLDQRVGALFDLLADVVAMALALFEQRQDQELGAAPLHLPFEHRGGHILPETIS